MAIPVIHLDELDAFPMAPQQGSEKFGAEVASFGSEAGLKGLGAMFITVQPGKRGFPLHNHLGNDEIFVILEGEGTYRFGSEEHVIKAGDVCVAPRGGPETAHQIINTGDGPLRYVGISTSNDPDVVEYPDSGKFAALAIAPGTSFFDAHLRYVGRRESQTDYWDGEDL
ncbi:cupin domain-containing protein [Aestuariibius sp. 2305UL40-4]|uniref:cupin domain-containing protein n=1 Tax=Aestuariibius violaceus TaxID=3234132 RepID=UPI00345E45D8